MLFFVYGKIRKMKSGRIKTVLLPNLADVNGKLRLKLYYSRFFKDLSSKKFVDFNVNRPYKYLINDAMNMCKLTHRPSRRFYSVD